MFRKTVSSLVIACALSGTAALAQGVPAMLAADRFTLDAKISAVDPSSRKVTVTTEDGRKLSSVVGPEVKNFAQLKMGDTIRLEYSQALVVALKKGAGLRSREEITDQAQAAAGAKPGVVAMRDVHFMADITKLDAASGTLTVKTAKGRVLDLKITQPGLLDGYKAGDQVEGEFAQVLSIIALNPASR